MENNVEVVHKFKKKWKKEKNTRLVHKSKVKQCWREKKKEEEEEEKSENECNEHL